MLAALAAVGCSTETPSAPTVPSPSPSASPTTAPSLPLPIEGSYYLTTIIDPSCADRFPRSVRRREFAITIRPAPTLSYFDFVTPDTFASWIRGSFTFPSGHLAADGNISVILDFYQDGAHSRLSIGWYGDTTLAYSAPDRAIGGLVGGRVAYAEDDDPQVECASSYHQIALTPR